MSQPVIQTSFHAGEWAPELNARVDLAKYHSAAALLRNFFVDYRGGASSCPGTKYVIQGRTSSKAIRLIPFTASFTVNYVLEFGDFYIRFIRNGAPVLESAKTITGATQANPVVITSNSHGYALGDWVYITGVGGMTQLNGRYFIISTIVTANTFGLSDLFGNTLNGTTFGAYTSGGTVARVFTLPSPYAAADLATLKFAQNVNTLVLCHASYVPYILTYTSATVWSLVPIQFGTTMTTPTGTGIATNAAGAVNYSYVVTAVDINGQESAVSAVQSSTVVNTAGATPTITFSWNAVSGAESYNVYRAGPSSAGVVPTGSSFGFLANVTGTSIADMFPSGSPLYGADFSITIPVAKNPFQGAGVSSITITAAGTYTSVPSVTIGAAPAGGVTATASVVLTVQGTPTVGFGGFNYAVGDSVFFGRITCIVATVGGGGTITAFQPMGFPGTNPGSVTAGSTPTNPITNTGTSGGGNSATANFVWGVGIITIISSGAGYTSAPAVTFSSGAATATAVLEASAAGNPQVPSYLDQRLWLAAKPNLPQTFDISQPDSYFNFNVSSPIQPDDAISATLVSTKLNTIKAMIPVTSGMIMFGDSQAWLVNGSGAEIPVSADNTSARAQAYAGASDLPPIVVNYDILYGQAKGSYIRDITFNFYTNIYTGTDISVLSSHLFFGFQITEWSYAEEPFKLIWAVRNDGILLSLTYVKEQEIIGWAHRDTLGLFKSTASIPETVTLTNGLSVTVDATYIVAQRTVNGQSLKYIERMAERIFPYGVEDAWCVDAGLQSAPTSSLANSLASGISLTASQAGVGLATIAASTTLWNSGSIGQVIRMGGGIATILSLVGSGTVTTVNVNITQAISAVDINGNPQIAAPGTWTVWTPATTFSGGEHLSGLTCTGLADGAVITPFVMPSNGTFTLSAAASKVTVGLAYTPQLQTLQLDMGQPTVQGKRKKVAGVAVRCKDTLGLSLGRTLSTLVPMKDLIVGNVGSQTNQVVTNLMVSGDAWTQMDGTWEVQGQYYVVQPSPMPASILGVIPDVVVGDS